ncbi:MAG: thrombospondin type 3 repeat-containing protein [Candidatus Geothermarchaeales archaeon]
MARKYAFMAALTVGLIIWIAASTNLWIGGFPSSVSGRPIYVKNVPQPMKNYCTVCHTQSSGKGPLNRFGYDFAAHGRSIDAIASADSDGDGFTNIEELEAGTFPGDPDSNPSTQKSELNLELVILSGLSIAVLLIAGLLILRKRRRPRISS